MKIQMGSDFEDSDPENAGTFAKIEKEEDSWDNSSSDEYDEEYGSEAGSQLERFEADDKGMTTISPKNQKEKSSTGGQIMLNEVLDEPHSSLPKLDGIASVDGRSGRGEKPGRKDTDNFSVSKFSGKRSGMSRKKKPLPFNALRFIA